MKTFKIVAILLIVGATTQLIAQNQRSEKRAEKMEKLEAQRSAFIVERLNLSTLEAQAFFPVYNEFRENQKALRGGNIEGKKNLDFSSMTDDQARDLIGQRLENEGRLLELKRAYSLKLQNVLSPVKVLELAKAEREFKREVLNRVKKRKRNNANKKKR